MKSILICEGKTDTILLSYYLNKTQGWKSANTQEGKQYIKENNLKGEIKNIINIETNKECSMSWYYVDTELLAICSSGGNSGIPDAFNQILTWNVSGSDKSVDKVVIITDRDDDNVENDIIEKIMELCESQKNFIKGDLKNNEWCVADYEKDGDNKTLDILLMVIPFDEQGTMETFLLNCLSETGDDEKLLVEKCRGFIKNAKNIEKVRENYLKERGITPKAEFSSYFSITSPNRTFEKGDKILKSIPWEKYSTFQETFKLLDSLKD